MSDDGYLLRPRDREEIERLAHQHRVWKRETDLVVDRAGFGLGDRLADLGCGPGFLALELADRVGPEGHVIALDTSERFLGHLRREAATSGREHIRPVVADVREPGIEPASLDGAICRWMMMFVPEPRRILERLAGALRPGGVFAAMEYAQFRTISLWPDGRHFRTLYDAVHRLIAGNGGDADIGARLPAMLVAAGFEVIDVLPFWRVGRPGSDLWHWLERTHANHANLVEAGLIDSRQLEDYLREWSDRSADPGALLVAPPLLATLARKC